MSTDPTGTPGGAPAGTGAGAAGQAHSGAGQPSEEELRRAYEAELSRVSTTDMMAQAAVSLLNLGARRLQAERDLGQVRDAIDGVRALLAILERTIGPELGPLRDALSQLQMAYAREVQTGGEGGEAAPAAQPTGTGSEVQGGAGGAGGEPAGAEQASGGKGPGPAESSGRLWVPGR